MAFLGEGRLSLDMAKDKNMRITTPDGEERGNGLKRLLVTLLIITTILYVGAFFGLRTDGARSLIEGEMSKRIGMEVQIGETKLAFPLGVAMHIVKAGEPGEDLGGFLAKEIKIKLLSGAGIHIEASGVDLVMLREDDGSWGPRFFSKLGDIPDHELSMVSNITKGFREHVSIDVDGALLKWIGDDGEVHVLMEGVVFEMQPTRLPGRKMVHYRLDVFKYSVGGPGGASGRDIVREWLAGPDSVYIEVLSTGELTGLESCFSKEMTEIYDEDQ
jgi:hypothetical protein